MLHGAISRNVCRAVVFCVSPTKSLRDFELFNFDFYLNRKRNESLFRTAASLSSIPVVTLLIGHTILLLYCRIGK